VAVGVLRFYTRDVAGAGTFSVDFDHIGGIDPIGTGTVGVDYVVNVTDDMDAINLHVDDVELGFDGCDWTPAGGPTYYHAENGAATGFFRYWKSGSTSGGWHFPNYAQSTPGAIDGDTDNADDSLSNAISVDTSALEAGPPPGAGVDIHTPDGDFLVTVELPTDWAIYIEDDGPGSFQLAINRGMPEVTAANFAKGNLFRITIPAISDYPIGDYILETGDFDLVSPQEEGGETLVFGGPGSLAGLRRALNDHDTVAGLPTDAAIPSKGIWSWNATSAGGIFARMVLEAVARGVLGYVTRTFTTLRDTDSVDWPITGKWQVPIGSNVYEEGVRLIKAGWFHWRMRPGWLLDAFNSRGEDLTGAAFGAGVVRFVRGVNIAESGLKHGFAGDVDATHAFGMGPEGTYRWVERVGFNPATDIWNEKPLEIPSDDAGDIDRAGEAAFDQATDAQRARQIEALNPLHRDDIDVNAGLYLPCPPWVADRPADGTYWTGDLVTLDTGGDVFDIDETQRIFSITIRPDANGYLAPPGVVFNAPYRQAGEESSPFGAGVGGGSSSSGGGSSSGSLPHNHTQYQRLSERGQPSGYPSLTAAGIIPLEQLDVHVDTVDPTATDDEDDDYRVGSRWINVTDGTEFLLVDATAAAAVWVETTGGGTGGGDLVDLGDVDIDPLDLSDHDSIRWDDTAGKWKYIAHGVPTSPGPPGVNDDETAGYHYLSRWIDTATGQEWVCVDPTDGAAVWVLTTVLLPSDPPAQGEILKIDSAGDPVWVPDYKLVPFQLNGNGSVITTGVASYIGPFPYELVFDSWSAYSTDGLTGSIEVALDADTYANHPPTSGDVITGTDPIVISTSTKGQDLAPTGWSSVPSGELVAIRVVSVTSLRKVDVFLVGRRV
jgi:hypothetical protein